MDIDIIGTYKSVDGNLILEIQKSEPINSKFSGTLNVKNSPVGDVSYTISNGEWYYTNNRDIAAFQFKVANIDASVNPDDREYIIMDSWAGFLTRDGEFKASISRSYVHKNGTRESFAFNTVVFVKQKQE
ncbi:hypothetical protein [Arsenophonus nasoniae]|uniref:hypothetical protein n=1 Tax=Arsenophonus nasoniae TaxID=638 RepID=UPI00387A30CF